MDKQENKQEQSFELSSEKVRSIVGQIPSALIRYGITVIGVVLSCFLPLRISCLTSKFILALL